MNRNADAGFELVLDQALDALAAGEERDLILARFAAHAGTLAPMLEAAELARAALSAPVPAPSLARGRARFLQAAQPAARPAGWLALLPAARLRAAPLRATLAALVLVALAALGTGAASATALPGDVLYPVKRALEDARLAVTVEARARDDYAETLRARRRLEAAQAAATGREAAVAFEGVVQTVAGDRLIVSAVVVLTPAGAAVQLGDTVAVEAHTRGGLIIADRIVVLRPGLVVPDDVPATARPTFTPSPVRPSPTGTPNRPRPTPSPTRPRPTGTGRPSATPRATDLESTRPNPTVTHSLDRPTETPAASTPTPDRPADDTDNPPPATVRPTETPTARPR